MATPETAARERPAEERDLAGINADYKEKFGFHDSEEGYAYKAPKGLSREVVESISEYKEEPQWMRDFRLKALDHFLQRPTPTWGGNLAQIDNKYISPLTSGLTYLVEKSKPYPHAGIMHVNGIVRSRLAARSMKRGPSI